MTNVLAYLNTITQAILGMELFLTPTACIGKFQNMALTESTNYLGQFLAQTLKDPALVASTIVWSLITYAIISLALIIPWRLFKSIGRGIGGIK